MTSPSVLPSMSSSVFPPASSRRGERRRTRGMAPSLPNSVPPTRTHLVRVARLSTGSEGRKAVRRLGDRRIGGARELRQRLRQLVQPLTVPGFDRPNDDAVAADQERGGDGADAVRVRELVWGKVRRRGERQAEPPPERLELLVGVLADAHDPARIRLLEPLYLRGRHLAHGTRDLVEEEGARSLAEIDARHGRGW